MNKLNILTCFISSISLILSCNERSSIRTGLEGKVLPNFSLLLRDSSNFNTVSIPEKKPFVLVYVSPTCPYCKAQVEDIVENINSLKNIQFYVITSHSLTELTNAYKEYHLSKYSNITIAQDTGYKISDYFGTNNVPYLAIYNNNKKLEHAFIGKLDFGQIRKIVNDIN